MGRLTVSPSRSIFSTASGLPSRSASPFTRTVSPSTGSTANFNDELPQLMTMTHSVDGEGASISSGFFDPNGENFSDTNHHFFSNLALGQIDVRTDGDRFGGAIRQQEGGLVFLQIDGLDGGDDLEGFGAPDSRFGPLAGGVHFVFGKVL